MAEKKNKISQFWARAAELMAKPKRKKMGVNVGKIARLTKAGQVVVVTDKILATGKISHALTIASPSISAGAAKTLKAAGCKVVSIEEMKKSHPTGKDVVLLC